VVDESEFLQFYTSQYGRLCWLGYLLTGSRAEAEELAQDALVSTYRRWRSRRPDDPPTYARRVLLNRRRSLARRAVREARHLAGLRAQHQLPPPLTEEAMVLWDEVRRLPRRQQEVLVLRFYEDRTEADVADLLGLPLGTVKSHGHRGLARLRQRVGEGAMPVASAKGES
jgi:RNA polymerase sigma-70 factor (sigma-E family)